MNYVAGQLRRKKQASKQQQVANVNMYCIDRVSSHALGNRTMFFMGQLINAGFIRSCKFMGFVSIL